MEKSLSITYFKRNLHSQKNGNVEIEALLWQSYHYCSNITPLQNFVKKQDVLGRLAHISIELRIEDWIELFKTFKVI